MKRPQILFFTAVVLFVLMAWLVSARAHFDIPNTSTLPVSHADPGAPFEEVNPIDSVTLVEEWQDSTIIGDAGKSMIVATKFRDTNGYIVNINFFSRKTGKWLRKNKYLFEKDEFSPIDPQVADFNNDGYPDFHYRAATAARGSNDVRRLFIYDPVGDSLIVMRNSLDYPNMIYNEKLDCIDAWMIHGCSSQVFLKIEKDSLREFAWIQSMPDYIEVYTVDRDGRETTLLLDSTQEYGCYTRFITYDPLVVREYPDDEE